MPEITEAPLAEDYVTSLMNGTDYTPAPVAAEPPAAEEQPPVPAAAVPTEAAPAEGGDPPKTPVDPAPDFNALLQQSSGGVIKSPEDLKTILEKSNSLAALEAKLKEATDKNIENEAKLSINPFADEFEAKRNELKKAGATKDVLRAFEQLNEVGDLKGLEPKEIRKLALQLRDGLTPKEAEFKIENEYKLNPEEYDENVVTGSKIQLKLDAKNDLAFLEKHKVDVSTPPANPNDPAVLEQNRVAKVKGYMEQATPVIKQISAENTILKDININGKQGAEAELIEFTVTEDSRRAAEEQLLQFALDRDIPINNETLPDLKQIFKNMLVVQNWPNMLIDAANKRELKVRAEYTNPSTINRGADNPDASKKTEYENYQSQLAGN